jgi:hypothetical protein
MAIMFMSFCHLLLKVEVLLHMSVTIAGRVRVGSYSYMAAIGVLHLVLAYSNGILPLIPRLHTRPSAHA